MCFIVLMCMVFMFVVCSEIIIIENVVWDYLIDLDFVKFSEIIKYEINNRRCVCVMVNFKNCMGGYFGY